MISPTRLTREIAILRNFPQQLRVGGETVSVLAPPRLTLVLEISPREDQRYGVTHRYDIICEVHIGRASDLRHTAAVFISSSRLQPPAEALIVGGDTDAGGLDLFELDSAVCDLVPSGQVWADHGTAIRTFINRWVTEHSLRGIADMTDFEVATALRSKSADFYNEILNYVAALDVTNPEIIRTYVRTALVSPEVIRETIRNNPLPQKPAGHGDQDLMNRTLELNPERRLKRKAITG